MAGPIGDASAQDIARAFSESERLIENPSEETSEETDSDGDVAEGFLEDLRALLITVQTGAVAARLDEGPDEDNDFISRAAALCSSHTAPSTLSCPKAVPGDADSTAEGVEVGIVAL